MSFQGDVAGIGLGELLQGLARGGKDGVLTLYGDGVASALGLKQGLVYLLEGPEEDPDEWKRRSNCAWADLPDANHDRGRRAAIARAERLETVFRMLEAPNLHFRFQPGALPQPKQVQSGAVFALDGATREAPWGQGLTVEFLLLEHARIADEATGGGAPRRYDAPRCVDASRAPQSFHPFLAQCDGNSTLVEIADRLGCPVRQVAGQVYDLMMGGVLRIATDQELLGLAHYELQRTRLPRAAARLAGWLARAPDGPLGQGEAQALLELWAAGQLAPCLEHLPARRSRELVRRLDHADPTLANSIQRWTAHASAHERDELARVHLAVLNLGTADQEADAITEILRLSRAMVEAGKKLRARALLRLVADRSPRGVGQRIELGSRLLEAGLVDEGAGLLVGAAREHVDKGDFERAVTLLHTVLKAAPHEPQAQGLLLQARARMQRNKRRRWQTLVVLSVVLVFAMAGVVRLRGDAVREARLNAVTDLLGRPTEALALLEQSFPGDDSPRVASLRKALETRLREDQDRARAGWLEGWSKIEREAVEGDPVAAFDAALTLARPPAVPTPEPWPTEGTLLQALAHRLAGNLAECRPTIDSPPEALHEEERLEELLIELAERVAASPPSPDREYFGTELDRLIAAIAAQRDERSTALRTRMQQQVLAQQDWLLGAARAHAAAGQLEQAVEVYDELLALEGSADLVPLLEAEVQKVREQYDALLRAFDHATAGRHADALSELERHAMDPRQHLLPWRVETSPSGARVRYGEGHTRTTPFVMYSSFGTPLKLEFELEGCERRQVEVSRPTDITVHMHRTPERRWATGAQVDAAPISVGPDHVFFDRAGRVERVDGRGGVKWSVSLPTLGGFARTPLFVPARPGTLLLVSEDGKAWFLDSADGSQEGPFDLGSPPEHGPYPMRGRIGAYFSNGTVAIWDASPEPQLLPAPSLGDQSDDWARRDGAEGDGSIMVLRRNAKAGEELASKWTRWRVDVLDEHYRVTRGADDEKAFTVRRDGAWSFVAWEAPNTLVPEGRLWVSDEGGLRSFLPVER